MMLEFWMIERLRERSAAWREIAERAGLDEEMKYDEAR